ncbi:MAG TPA: MFS transporter [Candidatus Dormibacteraeota bacterium]|nr:MFS transporter [Candidatus Dormibacteraeota bacterium]
MQNKIQLRLLLCFRLTRTLAAGLIAVAFPYYVLTQLHYSAFMLGMLYATATLATAALALFFGYLADVSGRKGTLFLAGILLPVGALIAFSSGRLVFLFAAAMLGGFSATGARASGGAGGAAQPVQSAAIADLTTVDNRTHFFSLFTFLSGLFGAGGILLAKVLGGRDAFLAAAIISAAGIPFVLPMRFPRRQRTNRPAMTSWKNIGKFSITGAVNGFSQGLIMPFLIPFFVIVYHLARPRMATYGFIAELLSSAALLISPFIERKLGFVKGVAFTRAAGAALLLLLPLTHNLPLALGIYLLTPALRVVAVPAQQTALTAMVRENETGRALGMTQVARLGASTGAIAFTGYAFGAEEIAAPFYAYAVVITFSLMLYFRLFGARPELRPESSPANKRSAQPTIDTSDALDPPEN